MKTIKKDKVSQEFINNLLGEINILKALDHPNILKVYEFY